MAALPPTADQSTRESAGSVADPGEGRNPEGRRARGGPAAPPMVELPGDTLEGTDGPVRLQDVFAGERQLIVYNHGQSSFRSALPQVLGGHHDDAAGASDVG